MKFKVTIQYPKKVRMYSTFENATVNEVLADILHDKSYIEATYLEIKEYKEYESQT